MVPVCVCTFTAIEPDPPQPCFDQSVNLPGPVGGGPVALNVPVNVPFVIVFVFPKASSTSPEKVPVIPFASIFVIVTENLSVLEGML